MALQVWLPLNGDLHNQGLNQSVTATNHGATINDSGKIGKCYQFGTSTSYLALSKQAMRSCTTEVSICFWLKILTWNSSYATYFQAGLNGSAWPNYTFGLLRNNTNSNCCFTISDGTSSSKASYLTPSLEINTWYHISLLYKTGHCLIYINGQLYKDYTASIVPNFSSIDRITLGMCNNYSQYQSNCQINDFRIYDHALSPKEVEDISKGLVLHYPLNDSLINPNNLFTGTAFTPEDQANFVGNSSTDWTKYFRYYNGNAGLHTFDNGVDTIKLSVKGNIGIAFVRKATEIGLDSSKYYTISCEAKCSQSGAQLSIGLSYYTNGNAWTWRGGDNKKSFTEVDEWQTFTLTFKPDSNTQYICYCFTVYGTNGSTDTFSIRHCKLEQGSTATAWFNDIIYDVSGYGNNGTIIGAASVAAGSPRYDVATYMNNTGTANHIEGNSIGVSDNIFTVSLWVKSNKSTNQVLFADPKMIIGTLNSLIYIFPTAAAGFSTTHFNNDKWNYIVAIRNNTAYQLYINGELETQNGSNNNYLHNATKLWLFNRSYNNSYAANTTMSDIRVYATALTADQVKELYQTSMLVDASGNIIPRGLED